jgi:hypothetical protein
MNGSDHVSRSQMPIGQLISRDRENERWTTCHVNRTNGYDFQCVDRPGFTQECFF